MINIKQKLLEVKITTLKNMIVFTTTILGNNQKKDLTQGKTQNLTILVLNRRD